VISTDIKPIETIYNGYRFRSRLEARWAVFFDAAGIEYQYEPEGFELEGGIKYLPDFYLPNIGGRVRNGKGLYIEVKGKMTHSDWEKVVLFSRVESNEVSIDGNFSAINPIMCVSDIPSYACDYGENDYYWNAYTIDCDDYPVWFYHMEDGQICIYGLDNVDDFTGFSYFNSAVIKARQARFEHGEMP
jgi:hypothetical protein